MSRVVGVSLGVGPISMSLEKFFVVEVRVFCLFLWGCCWFCLWFGFCFCVFCVRVNVVTGAHECWFAWCLGMLQAVRERGF